MVDFGISGRDLKLSLEDPLQVKTVLLSMSNSDLLTNRQAAEAIKLPLPIRRLLPADPMSRARSLWCTSGRDQNKIIGFSGR